MTVHVRTTGWQIDLEIAVRRNQAVRVRLGHTVPHHMIQICSVRDFYSTRFWFNFQLFLNVLCQIWLDSDRSDSFRETFFSFHIIFAYFCFLPSYNPTNCRYSNAKILNISELCKFIQTYFRPTHSFFRLLHVLQSYKWGCFVGRKCMKRKNVKNPYFLHRPTILHQFLQTYQTQKNIIRY